MNLKEIACADSPKTSYIWRNLNEDQRVSICIEKTKNLIPNCEELVIFLNANENGYVVVSILKPLGAGERGTLLLDIEEILKKNIDNGITIWLEPQADKSSLRKLRGIEVKK